MVFSVLLVEDDTFLREGLYTVLTEEGYAVSAADSLGQAREWLARQAFHLIVLDVGLPDGSGISLCRQLRARGNEVPILFLTAFDEEVQIVSGLDAGADDYVTKPFRLRELLSRVRALLRRTKQTCPEADGLVLHPDSCTATREGVDLLLTPTEYRILSVLLRNAGRTVTRTVLLENIWDEAGNYIDDNTLSVHISRLRDKLGTRQIVTVRGVGYCWKSEEGEDTANG